MTSRAAATFRHRPYDGSTQPFTVGLRPITEEEWLEPDAFLTDHLDQKEKLFAENLPAVFRAENDTSAAQREVLELVQDNLKRFHQATHAFEQTTACLRSSGRNVSLTEMPALLAASRLVQEDLVVMRTGPDGYRLAAASLCFPSSWRLSEKFGLSMTGIHESVPGFNGGRMGRVVARLFENLKTGQLLCRFNWSIYADGNLHHPWPERIPFDVSGETIANLFLRVERQTLRRLPKSGDLLFTIRIHKDPLAALTAQDDRAEIAAGLRQQLLALNAHQLTYKGLLQAREALSEALNKFTT